jgi:hypothetical protein
MQVILGYENLFYNLKQYTVHSSVFRVDNVRHEARRSINPIDACVEGVEILNVITLDL